MREIRTLRAMRRGLETAHGSDIEALPTETGSNKLGRAYGAMAPVLDPTRRLKPSGGLFCFMRCLQFAVGFSMCSITKISARSFCDSIFRPSCSKI